MNLKHTPGPWRVSKSGTAVDRPHDGSQVRFVRSERALADAPLVAAAPAMKALLDAILLEMNEAPGCPDCGVENGEHDGEHDEACRAVEIGRVLNAAAGAPFKHVPTAQDPTEVTR
jgi:hypothetical protein